MKPRGRNLRRDSRPVFEVFFFGKKSSGEEETGGSYLDLLPGHSPLREGALEEKGKEEKRGRECIPEFLHKTTTHIRSFRGKYIKVMQAASLLSVRGGGRGKKRESRSRVSRNSDGGGVRRIHLREKRNCQLKESTWEYSIKTEVFFQSLIT